MRLFIFFAVLLAIFFTCSVEAAQILPVYNLSVSFDIKENLMKGVSTIILQEKRKMDISAGDLKIISVKQNGLPLKPEIKDGVLQVSFEGALEIVFEGLFRDEYETKNPENTDVMSKKVINDKGIYLTGRWYPSIESMAFYNLKAYLPKGFIAVSEADEITVADTGQGKEYSFSFPHPLRKINLVAGKYTELKETFKGIDIYGYFFPGDRSIAKTYIGYTKKYLEKYEELLVPYPYKRFSIVENFLPAGYSMPTFTVLGQDVVRLPSLLETSLGHEILHQWFGNLVYINYKKGNWSEGLTTYLSDHLDEEQKGKGWQYRENIIIDYESYVTPEKEFPLKDFVNRNDFTSKAIGYGKGAMLFHMLRNLTGESTFYMGLKEFIKENKFQEASFDDLQEAFEKISGKNLEWFFTQWINRKGNLSVEIKDPKIVVLKGIPTVSFEVVQKGEPYIFNLSLRINTDKGEIIERLNIKKAKESFEIPVEGDPLGMIIDRDYDVMRKLSEEEYPPVIARLLGDEKRLIVMPEEENEKYNELVNFLKGEGFALKDENEIKDEDIKTNSLLVLGFESPVLRRLFGGGKKTDSGFSLGIKKNPLNTTKVIAIAYGDSKNEVDLAAKKIFRYRRYSSVRFKDGKNIEKKTEETEKGIKVSLYKPVVGIQPQKTMKLDEIIRKILDKPVIYVGERHTNYEDHKVQLKVIMSLYEKGRKFAIGMEMFQKPFQKAINDYISGTISEKEFLKASQYFKRWQFDYNLYREIIDYAKAKNIPVIALNLWSEIIKKVSSDGLDGLTDLERGEIPEDLDMSDEDYKERLQDIFESHRKRENKNFGNFYQSQILWDETMAHSVDEFLRKNPGYQVVVLTGLGHIMYGSGIPKRVYRLNGKDYVTLIPDTGITEDNLADFVLFTEHLPPPVSFKLGVILGEMNGRVKIEKITPGGIAEKAGIRKGDILISFDDWKIEDADDVKIFMFDKKQGEMITIKAFRKKFLYGYEMLEFSITL